MSKKTWIYCLVYKEGFNPHVIDYSSIYEIFPPYENFVGDRIFRATLKKMMVLIFYIKLIVFG